MRATDSTPGCAFPLQSGDFFPPHREWSVPSAHAIPSISARHSDWAYERSLAEILRWLLVHVQPLNSSSIHTQVSCRLLKISPLVANAARAPIVSTVEGISGIRQRIGMPTNGPGRASTADTL